MMARRQPTKEEIVEYACDLLGPTISIYRNDQDNYFYQQEVEKAVAQAIEDLSWEEEEESE